MKKMKEFAMFDYHEYGSRIDPILYKEDGIMPIDDCLVQNIYMNALSLDNFNYGYFEEEYHPSKHISEKYDSKIYRKLLRGYVLNEVLFKARNGGFNEYRDYRIDYSDSLWHLPEYKLYGKDFVFQLFLTRLTNLFSNYIFGDGATNFIKSMQEESKEDVDKKLDINDCAEILLDFMNFVAKSRDWHTVFTINDLYEEYSKQKHKAEIKELKDFINLSNYYKKELSKGKKLDDILSDILEKNNIYITKVFDSLNLNSLSDEGNKKVLDRELYALAYAYAKSSDRTKSKCSKSKNKNVSQEKFITYAKTLQDEENLENSLNSILGKNNVEINELMSKKISAVQYETITEQLYNLLCAYYYNKMDFQTSNEIIDAKIKEMSKR